MEAAQQGTNDLNDQEQNARIGGVMEQQFPVYMERMMRNAIPQPRAGGGPFPSRMMKTSVEKLTHLKQFPNWDILLNIAAQFCGCRHEMYSIGETYVNTNQGVKNVNEHLDLSRELAENNVLTRSMVSSSLAPATQRQTQLHNVQNPSFCSSNGL